MKIVQKGRDVPVQKEKEPWFKYHVVALTVKMILKLS
jgi:hypothetical protein